MILREKSSINKVSVIQNYIMGDIYDNDEFLDDAIRGFYSKKQY